MRTLDSDKKEIEKSYYVKMLETFSLSLSHTHNTTPTTPKR